MLKIVIILASLAAPIVALSQSSASKSIAFFQALPSMTPEALPPAVKLIPMLEEDIGAADKAGVSALIPVLRKDLTTTTANQRKVVVLAYCLIGAKEDGASYLENNIGDIRQAVMDDDPGVSSEAALGMLLAKPAAPTAVLNVLKDYLSVPDAAEIGGPAAVHVLLTLRSDDQQVTSVVASFVSQEGRSVTAQVKLLRAIGMSGASPVLAAAAVHLLHNSTDPSVRLAAITSLTRMGPDAIKTASGELSRVAGAASTDAQSRAAANGALSRIDITSQPAAGK